MSSIEKSLSNIINKEFAKNDKIASFKVVKESPRPIKKAEVSPAASSSRLSDEELQ